MTAAFGEITLTESFHYHLSPLLRQPESVPGDLHRDPAFHALCVSHTKGLCIFSLASNLSTHT